MAELANSEKVITSASARITRRGTERKSYVLDLLENGVAVASGPCIETDGHLSASFDKPVMLKASARYEWELRCV